MKISTIILLGIAALSCSACFRGNAGRECCFPRHLHRRMEVAAGADSRAWKVGQAGSRSPAERRCGDTTDAAAYWEDVLRKLDSIPRAQLSPAEQINYDVYRPEIENFVADEKFRDYEMPANSDSAFWTDLGYTARRPFKTITDYKNWIAQIRDVPRYFRSR